LALTLTGRLVFSLIPSTTTARGAEVSSIKFMVLSFDFSESHLAERDPDRSIATFKYTAGKSELTGG
jgi:hypothetical protein